MKKFTKWNYESILVKFSELHKGRYTYPDFEYINTAQTFTVRCPVHGDFQQKVRKHLEGQGCKSCNTHKEVKWENPTGYYDENGKQVQLRLYTIWRGIQQRCKESYWGKHSHYKGTTCSDNFKSWDYFYEWCQEQTGVTSCDELGKPYELDKDLLGTGGQKVYTEDVGKHIGGLYGTLNVVEVFDTTKEFSLDEVIVQLSELDFDSLNFIKTDKRPVMFDEALQQIILGEHYSKLPYMKRVHLINGLLVSNYDKSYIYIVGAVHFPKPRNKYSDDLPFSVSGCEGIYCQKGYPDKHYGNIFLEVEPLNPKENTANENKFGYKEGVLVKQVLPFQTDGEYHSWLTWGKGIPADTVKYLKYIK